jgi:hypothetical protein
VEPLFRILFSANRKTPSHCEWVVACLRGAWPNILGDKLASVCRPMRFENSNLTIEMLQDGWEEAVKSVRAALSAKLRDTTGGEVKTITIVSQRDAD